MEISPWFNSSGEDLSLWTIKNNISSAAKCLTVNTIWFDRLFRPRNTNTFFPKYSRNLNISEIFWSWYTKNNFPIIFPKYKKNLFSDANRNLKFHVSNQTSLIWNSKFFNEIKENLLELMNFFCFYKSKHIYIYIYATCQNIIMFLIKF